MRRRVVEQPMPDLSRDAQILADAEAIVAHGRPLTPAEFEAVEAVLEVDSRRHLELTMCLMTPVQAGSYQRHQLNRGDWGNWGRSA